MKTRAAAILRAPGTYEVIDVDLDEPRQGEVRVRMVAAGLCHTDDHIATGQLPVGIYPMIGGHEGAGIVDSVGTGTPDIEVGDHVVFSFLPVCGRCRWCATGHQNLCDLGANLITGARYTDIASYRNRAGDALVGQTAGLGTFAEYTTVDVRSVIKLPKDIPLQSACLLGCGVVTGWGSAVYSAEVKAGDVVIVMGVGGIGMNAVQGAALAGASEVIAVDPVDFKRKSALDFGATNAFETIEKATEYARSRTNGQGADSTIITIGVISGAEIAKGFHSIRKAGTLVVTAIGGVPDVGIPIGGPELVHYQKRIQGALFGAANPTTDIPKMVRLYQDGLLKLDELITRRYALDEVAEGYADMHAGLNIRGIVTF